MTAKTGIPCHRSCCTLRIPQQQYWLLYVWNMPERNETTSVILKWHKLKMYFFFYLIRILFTINWYIFYCITSTRDYLANIKTSVLLVKRSKTQDFGLEWTFIMQYVHLPWQAMSLDLEEGGSERRLRFNRLLRQAEMGTCFNHEAKH